ncbi:Inhibitor of growth protein 5 [Choanephora cucurbitarum]|uniref:Chromatin modification-related protein n=1 Tax=Choanephora cucurbitarum TaxID=101091 RepID=A0A1C7NLZ2_9FUNG|nr:Inhibitor of growth protein 5 [Choanephora cucurbitarum]
MSASVADIFEEYVESLQNLPSEIDQNMHELRSMDEEFQRFREIYTKRRRAYAKLYRVTPNTTTNTNLLAARQQLEKDYRLAIQKQDQKIDLTKRMYDLVSRHIERIDSQMAKSELGDVDWMGGAVSRKASVMAATDDMSWKLERKRPTPHDGVVKKSRTLHSSRPNPALEHNGVLPELEIDPNEPKYCYCNQVSFGDMVACDGENCEKEWFHYACVGLTEPPIGKWYCEDCSTEEGYRKKFKRFTEDVL